MSRASTLVRIPVGLSGDASGNIGIGTSSPGVKFDTVGVMRSTFDSQSNGGATTHGLVARQSTTSTKALVGGYSTSGNQIGAYLQAVNFGTAYEDLTLQPQGGNLGLGVTPSAWSATYKALQVGGSVGLWGGASSELAILSSNAYLGGSGYARIIAGYATRYSQNVGTHTWSTAATSTAGSAITWTDVMTLDASGNLGVGTTSPGARLDVSSASSAVAGFSKSGSQTVYAVSYASNAGIAAESGGLNAVLLSSSNNLIQLYTNNAERARIDTSGNFLLATSASKIGWGSTGANYIQANTSTNVLAFGTNSSEAMRIESSGNLLIGATSAIASEKLYVNGSNTNYITRTYNSNASPYGAIFSYTGAAPNGTSNEFFRCDDTGAVRMAVRSNGGIANFSANNVNLSDQRTKTDIQNAGGYLAKICAIPVRTFKYKDQTDDLLNLGVIAQEVETVAPELVDVSGFGETPEDGVPLKAIYQTDLQYALMKCIQEQQAIIESLKARLDAANL